MQLIFYKSTTFILIDKMFKLFFCDFLQNIWILGTKVLFLQSYIYGL